MSVATSPTHTAFGGSDDRGLQRQGRELLISTAAAIRALQLYPLENQAVINTLEF